MMKKMTTLGLVFGVFLCWNAQAAFAAGSGGIRVELPDAGAAGKGFAFVGEANTPSAVYFNPAGLTQLTKGQHLTFGFSHLNPMAKHTDFSGVETQMIRQAFVIPHFYYANDFGLENWRFGFGATSNWGTGTAWNDDSFARYNSTHADVKNFDTMLTAAYEVNPRWSIAGSLDTDYSTANKNKKLLQSGGADGDYSLKLKAHGIGYRLATLYKPNERHGFGLMYRSPIQEKYRGKTFLHGLNASGSNYLALIGSDTFEVETDVEFQLPQSVVFGYSFKPDNKWTFNFDVEWMDWSSIEQEFIEYKDTLTTLQRAVLDAGNPVPHDWKSVMSAAIGTEYAWNDRLRLRGGYYWHESPVPDGTFEANLPDANSHGITSGFGYDIMNNSTIDFAYSALKFENRTIGNTVASGTINGKYEQIMHMFMTSYTMKF